MKIKNGLCIVWFISLFAILGVGNVSFIPDEEEAEVVKYEKFSLVPSTNDDLEDLNSFSIIGYYDGKIWWVEGNVLNIYTVQLIFKSTDLITGSTTTEETYNITKSPTDIGMVLESVALYIFENDIYGSIAFHFYDDLLNKWAQKISCRYSNDGGSSWNNALVFSDIFEAEPTNLNQCNRVFKIGATFYGFGSTNYSSILGISAREIGGLGALVTLAGLDVYNSFYQGCKVGSEYWFVWYNGANLILESYDGTTFTAEETLTGLSIPANWNAKVQQYWRFIWDNYILEFIMDEDQFNIRVNGGDWAPFSDTGTTTNGICWGFDSDGNYIPKYSGFKDSIYKFLKKDYPVKIMETTWDLYTGWDNFFTNGADAIYQVDLAHFVCSKCMIHTSIWGLPTANIIAKDKPFANQTLILYNNAENLFTIMNLKAGGKITNSYFRYVCTSPLAIDFKREFAESFTTKDSPEILTTAVNNNMIFLYDGGNISATPATTYTIDYKIATIQDIRQLVCLIEGYIAPIYPDFEIRYNTWGVNNQNVIGATLGLSKHSCLGNLTQHTPRIIIHGKYTVGIRAESVVQGDPGVGTIEKTYAPLSKTITDALATQIESDRNKPFKTLIISYLGEKQMAQVGTYITLTYARYNITSETWYILECWYDAINQYNKIAIIDGKWIKIL
jgi:hypothetical protein